MELGLPAVVVQAQEGEEDWAEVAVPAEWVVLVAGPDLVAIAFAPSVVTRWPIRLAHHATT